MPGNVINSTERAFHDLVHAMKLPEPLTPGVYTFDNLAIIVSDVSDRPDIIESQKDRAQKDLSEAYRNELKEIYSVEDIAVITALKDDMPEVFTEMRKYLLGIFQEHYAKKSRIDNARDSDQLTALSR
jgi:hypothetical protein